MISLRPIPILLIAPFLWDFPPAKTLELVCSTLALPFQLEIPNDSFVPRGPPSIRILNGCGAGLWEKAVPGVRVGQQE